MSELDDVSLRGDDAPADEEWSVGRDPGPGSDGGGPPLLLIVVALIVIAGLVAAFFWWRGRGAVDEPMALSDSAFASPAAEEAPEEAPPDDEPFLLPPLDQSDEVLRTMIAELSSHSRLAGLLVNDRIIERFVATVANIAWDEDPRAHLGFLRPKQRFVARPAAGEGAVIDPRSFARFDVPVAIFESLDVEGSARLYRRMRPLLEQSYQELGYPMSWQRTLELAIQKLLETPRVGADVSLEQKVLSYRFADPRLERLSPAQKLLIGTGPESTARVQRKLRELARAIGLEVRG